MIEVVSCTDGERFVALKLPKAMVTNLPNEATHVLVRMKSAEGFKALMISLMDAAATAWPEIAKEWDDLDAFAGGKERPS